MALLLVAVGGVAVLLVWGIVWRLHKTLRSAPAHAARRVAAWGPLPCLPRWRDSPDCWPIRWLPRLQRVPSMQGSLAPRDPGPRPQLRKARLGAIPLFEQALADRERVLGPDNPKTLESRNNLVRAYDSVGGWARQSPRREHAADGSLRCRRKHAGRQCAYFCRSGRCPGRAVTTCVSQDRRGGRWLGLGAKRGPPRYRSAI
jgi:hypothetical protein